jgi:hypothetical protein
MPAWLRHWWSEVSPAQRWQRERARRAAWLGSIGLETADRVASELLRGNRADVPIDKSTAAARDAYLAGFMLRHGNKRVADPREHHEERIEILREPVATDDDGARVVACAHYDEVYAQAGDLRIWWRPEPTDERAPSIAHLVLDELLTTAELEALADAPTKWSPDLSRHPAPVALPPARPPLDLDTRSRAWARIGAPIVATLALLGMAGFVAMMLGQGHGNPWCGLPIAALIACSQLVRTMEVWWLEPGARRLAIDDVGLKHPRTGQRIAWNTVRAMQPRWFGFTLLLADDTAVHVPQSLFMDGPAAQRYLRRRIAKAHAGPYRT